MASAILITLFLFFIDEGYYDFRWMAHPGNWVAFLIYFLPIFLCQWLIFTLVLRKYSGAGKTAMSIILGAIIAVTLVVKVVFAHT